MRLWSEIYNHFFDGIPHVLGSRPSNLRLTVKRRPPRESQGNFKPHWRWGLFKNYWIFLCIGSLFIFRSAECGTKGLKTGYFQNFLGYSWNSFEPPWRSLDQTGVTFKFWKFNSRLMPTARIRSWAAQWLNSFKATTSYRNCLDYPNFSALETFIIIYCASIVSSDFFWLDKLKMRPDFWRFQQDKLKPCNHYFSFIRKYFYILYFLLLFILFLFILITYVCPVFIWCDNCS